MVVLKLYGIIGIMVFDRHECRGHDLKRFKECLAVVVGFAVVPVIDYSFAAEGKLISLTRHRSGASRMVQFLELFFKTIGVVTDCLQSFNESVSNNLGKAVNIKPLLLLRSPGVIYSGEISQKIFLFDCGGRANGYSTGGAPAIDRAERRYPSSGRMSRHSEKSLWCQNLSPWNKPLVDSPIPSPIKQNRAGHHEEGDYNQRDCRSDPYRDN